MMNQCECQLRIDTIYLYILFQTLNIHLKILLQLHQCGGCGQQKRSKPRGGGYYHTSVVKNKAEALYKVIEDSVLKSLKKLNRSYQQCLH